MKTIFPSIYHHINIMTTWIHDERLLTVGANEQYRSKHDKQRSAI